nr:uncharacterized protein LOC107435281 [Ziziphus jujuba var. spinosa]
MSLDDLPNEMLSAIAKCLGYCDVLSFRLVCKRFLRASNSATAEIESTREPLFLLYPGFECYMISKTGLWYPWPIPQLHGLVGAKCLASSMGWLLVFQAVTGSMFFIQPFCNYDSTVRIPKFPHTRVSRHCCAAFSSPPLSGDCIVVVVNRLILDDNFLDLQVVRHGCAYWTGYRIQCPRTYLVNIKGSAYHDGIFYFFSPNGRGIRLCPKNLVIQKFDLLSNVDLAAQHPPFPPFPIFELRKNYVRFVGLKKRLGLEENNRDCSIVSCGTVMTSLDNHNKLVVIFNEDITHRSARYRSTALYQGRIRIDVPLTYERNCSRKDRNLL